MGMPYDRVDGSSLAVACWSGSASGPWSGVTRTLGDFLRGLADNRRPGSLADRYRQRRFALLKSLVVAAKSDVAEDAGSANPFRILDVGGTSSYWERMGFAAEPGVQLVLLNLYEQDVPNAHMRAVIGDASNMSMFGDAEFDLVVSNSVIEHLPTLEIQGRMAREILRVGKRHWVQTPNRRFPLEPHFLFPFFQYLPVRVRAWLLGHTDLGWYPRERDRAVAVATVLSVRLMTHGELRTLFPQSRLVVERAFGLAKSFIVVGGWNEMPIARLGVGRSSRRARYSSAIDARRRCTRLGTSTSHGAGRR